ncbi:alpha/beta fold hydrolase [Dapis sp. BLCC M229]|uniref:alpha/beta fold hydrolase n=1 Tax=Dapis sp. BLCC M229 TaxID=3400188 RepID=UPI003CF7C926
MKQASNDFARTRYAFESVDDVRVFYRESGDPQRRAVVLLHGFPSSSHMYREVLDNLGDEFYLIAPDYPGFGNSDFPDPKDYKYTFDNLAKTTEALLEQKGITEWVLAIQDYGAPVGFRLATKYPKRVKGLIVMNGNAYEEGFDPDSSAPVRSYWESHTEEKEAMIADQLLSLQGVKWQYTQGTRNPDGINPDNWTLDFAWLQRPGQRQMQLDLFYDYRTNVELYPEWQAFLKESQPPTLIAWGERDPIFIAAGAEAYRRHLESPEFHLFPTGHFVLEEDAPRILPLIRSFLLKIG